MLRSILLFALFFMYVHSADLYQDHLKSTSFSEEWIFSGMEYFTLRADIYTFETLLNVNHD